MESQADWCESVRKQMKDLLGSFKRREDQLKTMEEKLNSDRADFDREMVLQQEKAQASFAKEILEFENEKEKLEMEKERMKKVYNFQSNKVKLDVGGHVFSTSLTTLRRDPESMLAVMFSGRHELVEEDGTFFLDRDGTYFRHILNFLRDGFQPDTLPQEEVVLKQIQAEANYYQLNGLVEAVESILNPPPPAPDVTQQEINSMLGTVMRQTADTGYPPCLDVGSEPGGPRHVDFVFHNMTKTNLDFNGKKLSGLSFAHTTFTHNVSFIGAQLVNACFYGCEFASHVVVDFSHADICGADFRQCRCVEGGPQALGTQSFRGGFMFGSSCSSFAQLIKTGRVKFDGAKHIGAKFDPNVLDVIRF